MDDIQKELDKAEAYKSAGNFEKATKTYFKIAKAIPDNEKSINLLSNAYSEAIKTEKPHFIFEFAQAYYSALVQVGRQEEIQDLMPGFIELSSKLIAQIETMKLDEKVEILQWALLLHRFAGDQEGAYEISLKLGDVYFDSGRHLLSTSHLVGKEEKYNRGIEFYSQAIETFKEVILNSNSLERILRVKLDKIARFIDINRITEAIEDTAHLVRYFNDQNSDIHPFSKKDLSLKIADLFASKSIEKAAKQIKITSVLQKSAIAGFEEAKEFQKITSFMWTLSQIVDDNNELEHFIEFCTQTFELAVKYKDPITVEAILKYLQERGSNVCESIINSRMLLVKKGSIEFQNSRGVSYLTLRCEFAKANDDPEIVANVAEYLFNYGKLMYEKKLRKRALPYLEFAGKAWWDLSETSEESKQVVKFLESTIALFLADGKLEEAVNTINSIVDLHTYFKDFKKAGESAFSFAKTLGENNKMQLEMEFLNKAFTNYKLQNSISKLIELLDYTIQRSDSLFVQDPILNDDLMNFLNLAKNTAVAISIEKQGELLSGTTFKAINSGLSDLAIICANEAFDMYKSYDIHLASDFYFNVGTKLLHIRQAEALDFISKSTNLASDEESLEELVLRNLQFLMDETLKTPRLETKLILVNQFGNISEIVNKNELYQSFLFPFVKHLAEHASESFYFSTMNDYLMKVFTIFYEIDPNHGHLQEILEWTNDFISNNTTQESLSEMITLSLNFHEKVNQPQQFLSFIWPIVERWSELEMFQAVIEIYQQTIAFLKRVKSGTEEFTEKFVQLLDRGQKSRIHDEKFDDAWIILQTLYEILIDSGMKAQGVALYQENALLFAQSRLDLALEQWISILAVIEDLENGKEIIETISSEITTEVLSFYKEEQNTNAVLQLFNTLTDMMNTIGDADGSKKIIFEATQYLLTQGDYNGVFEWGNRGLSQALETKDEPSLFNFSNLFLLVGKGLLKSNPEVALKLITTASKKLNSFGESGFDYYTTKLSEIYEDLYRSSIGKEIAISESARILKYFKDTNKRSEEARFLFTIAKIALNEGNISEGLSLISDATTIFQELKDEENLSEIVSICLAKASNFTIGSSEYEALIRQAMNIQQGDIKISEEKTKDAFGDIFDGMMDDMTSLFDPKVKKTRQKMMKKK
jgi:tetratricopeptide (TPR) repeat protein